MGKSVFYLIALFVLFSCREEQGLTGPMLPPGSYQGTFQRWSNTTTEHVIAQVHFAFEDGGFSGSSNMSRYPAVCNGKYSVSGLEVDFTNLCVWTADFDWTYILNGKYQISTEGDEFVLMQHKGNWIDIYRLKRNTISN